MNNYNLYQTGNNNYCDCCSKDIDTDNDDYIIGQEQNKGFIFCTEKCNAKEGQKSCYSIENKNIKELAKQLIIAEKERDFYLNTLLREKVKCNLYKDFSATTSDIESRIRTINKIK